MTLPLLAKELIAVAATPRTYVLRVLATVFAASAAPVLTTLAHGGRAVLGPGDAPFDGRFGLAHRWPVRRAEKLLGRC